MERHKISHTRITIDVLMILFFTFVSKVTSDQNKGNGMN